MATGFDIIRRAERIELRSAELYRLIGEVVPLSAEDRALVKRLELEEIQHAARLRLLASQYRNDARLFDLSAVDCGRLEDLERWTEALCREVEAGKWSDDLPGLKRRIAMAEERCCQAHAELIAHANRRVAKFFRELAEQDRAHLELLRDG